METILLAVTAVSLLVALIMSAAAWRMAREERARAAARIAALASAAASAPAGTEWQASYGETSPERSGIFNREGGVHDVPTDPINDSPTDPIVAAPAPPVPVYREPAPVVDELPLRPMFGTAETRVPEVPRVPSVAEAAALHEPSVPAGFLSGAARPTVSGNGQRGLMAAAAVLFVVLGTGAYQLLSDDGPTEQAVRASAPAVSAPLELISLRHAREGRKLELSGLVRNPAAGVPVEGLNAVVFLFDAQGGFISSGRVGVDFKRLAPGDESPFVVTMDAPSNVSRYRVSFRTDAGVVAHVDRRSEQPVATAIVR